MCLSIPAKVLEFSDNSALVQVDSGLVRRVVLAPGVQPSEWVLLYAGVAIGTLSADEAEEMRRLIKQSTSA
jgi:hydrogenase assembly chaperone HypC/HupF